MSVTGSDILLTLNNNRAEPMEATLTAYKPSGNAVSLISVSLVANESRQIKLAPVLAKAGLVDADLGWFKVAYKGISMELGAQLALYSETGSSAIDSPRSLSLDYKSGRRDAAFWLPIGGEAHLSLSNAQGDVLTTSTHCGATIREDSLAAFSTASFDVKRSLQPSGRLPKEGSVEACEVLSSGSPKALRISGAVVGKDHAAPIRFYDPETATFSNLTAVGLKTNAKTSVNVMNSSDHAVEFRPVIREASLTGFATKEQAAIVLAPHAAASVNVQEALDKLYSDNKPLATLTLQTDADKGDLIGSVTQLSYQDSLIEDVPLRTSNPPAFARGSYPLRWDEDYTNMVSVTNTADAALSFAGEITAGKMLYVLPHTTIAPGATHVIDVDRIRKEEIPDVWGKTLPRMPLMERYIG